MNGHCCCGMLLQAKMNRRTKRTNEALLVTIADCWKAQEITITGLARLTTIKITNYDKKLASANGVR